VDTAAEYETQRARELCANIHAGEIVIFDKAYVDFGHLADLAAREVFWVTRAKDNLQCRVVRKFQDGAQENILRDDLIVLTTPAVQKVYPVAPRRLIARVEVDGELREMTFLTNNLTWSAQTIADLYRCRWSIEVFFKELKQTLQLADFLGTQRARRQMAGLDGLAGLCPPALLRLLGTLAPQLHPPVCPDPLGALAKL
jgi:hypothetical protein